MATPSWSARVWSSRFHSRRRTPLLPPQSAVISRRVAFGVASRAEFVPPAADALDREDGSVVGYAEIDPSGVGGDVVDAIGHRLAELGDGEVVHPDRLRMAFRAKLAAAVLAVANQLLLLRVDRDHRLAGGLERLHRRIDGLELRVAVGMLGALTGLAVALQAEPELGQQPANQLLPGAEALPSQRRGEMPLALAHPAQRGLGVTADRGLHQTLQRCQQQRLRLGSRLAATASTAHSPSRRCRALAQFCQAAPD